MIELVEVIKGEVFADSQVIAERVGVKHQEVVRAIGRVLTDYPDIQARVDDPLEHLIEEARVYRGQSYVAYLMNREFFSLLMGRFTNKKARDWQRQFNAAFYSLESALMREAENKGDEHWLTVRQQSKQIRVEETDVIKQFVAYAIEQGSQNAKFYYKHVTNATYACLQLIQYKKPKLRDTLDTMELAQVMVAENVARKALVKYMDEGLHYKEIFVMVKHDLEALGGSLYIEAGKKSITPSKSR